MQSVTKSWHGLRMLLGVGHVMRMNVTTRNIRHRNKNIETCHKHGRKKKKESEHKTRTRRQTMNEKAKFLLQFLLSFFCLWLWCRGQHNLVNNLYVRVRACMDMTHASTAATTTTTTRTVAAPVEGRILQVNAKTCGVCLAPNNPVGVTFVHV